jgi:hypothetical protein
LNRDASWLTRAQAALLDAHFHVEQQGRARAGRFFGFNGTAAVWRKQTIVDAGGWDSSTLTEDLDLSLRAWLRGARFAYADDVAVPAELPRDISAWRIQQRRWAKGALQTARLRMVDVSRANISLVDKIDIALKLTQNLAFAALFVVVALLPFAGEHWFGALGAVPAILALLMGTRRLLDVVFAIGLCAAMSPSAAFAAIAGLVDDDRAFHRTPKRGASGSISGGRGHAIARAVELLIGALEIAGAIALVLRGDVVASAFLWVAGFSFVAIAAMPQVEGETHDQSDEHRDARPRRLLPRRAKHRLVEQR